MVTGVSSRKARTALFASAGVALAAGAWVITHRGPSDPGRESDSGLVRLLGSDEESAFDAQVEMERRYGASPTRWKAALNAPESRARSLAVESVGKSRSPEVVGLLTQALADPASLVRTNAVQALASQEPDLALRPMLSAIMDEDTWVSEAAASKIRELNKKEAVPVLIAALRNPDRETGVFALGALKRLTGQRFHAAKPDSQEKWNRVAGQWEAWWNRAKPTWPATAELSEVAPIHPSRRFLAPDFSLHDSDGKELSLGSLRGKVVLLNFWMMNCGPCIAEMPGLEAISRRYRNQGLVVIGVENNSPPADELKTYALQRGITYPLVPASEAIREAYGHIHDVPVTFLIDREGQIRREWAGDREERVFDSAIKRVL